MGYDLHITRKQHWSDEDGPAIELREWLAIVEGDPEMRLDGFAEAKLPGGSVLRVDDPGMAVWTAWSGNVEGGNQAWFWLGSSGNLMAKNPDVQMIVKMHEIAQLLGAKVQGDEGEVYGADGEPADAAADHGAPQSITGFFQRFWRRTR